MEGTRVTFEGIVTGKPEPVVRWFREGKQLTDQADFEIAYREGRVSLSIPEAYSEDSGQFMCTAENEAGLASSTAELLVRATLIPPGFVEMLKTTHAYEGETVRLEVKVTGDPPPTVAWFKDGNRLVSSPDFQISEEDGGVHHLTIPEAFFEDTGKFEVKALNPAGEAICSAQLHVQPIPEKPQPLAIRSPQRKPIYDVIVPAPTTPVSAKSPTSRSPREEQQPMAKVAKLLRPSEFSPKKSPDRYRQELDMQIEQELPPFEARFKLYSDEEMMQPQQQQPQQQRAPPSPQLKHKTKLPQEKVFVPDKNVPKFTKPLRDVHTNQGERLVLEIIVEGNPEPIVKWYRESIEIKNSPDYQVVQVNNHYRLTIAEVFPEDSGRYEAVAMNANGTTRTECFVRVEGSPSPPLSPQAPPLPTQPPPPMPQRMPSYKEEVVIQVDRQPPVKKAPPPVSPKPVHRLQPPPLKDERPSFAKPLTNIEAKQSDGIIFEVKVNGSPEPVVRWYREDVEIASSPDFELSRSDTTYRLTISEVFPEDAGKFSCVATNALGFATTEAYLYVQPSPDSPVQSPVAEEKFREELEMQVEGQLPPFEKRIALFGSPPKPMPPDMAPRRPFVTDKEKPSFIEPLHDTYAKQGEPVILEVTVDGHPEPIIKWYRDDIEIYSSPDYQLSRSNKTYRLAILEVFPEDAGQFKVVATNAEGSVATEARLMVEPGPQSPQESFTPSVQPQWQAAPLAPPLPSPKPESISPASTLPRLTSPVPSVPPSFIQGLPDTRLVEGTNVKLECRVLGKPFPQVIFTKGGQPLVDGPRHRVNIDERTGRCSLVITGTRPEDEGEYICTAMNPSGEAATSCQIKHEGPRVQQPVTEDISPEFIVTSFENRLMEQIEYRDGKVRLQSETETEYDTDQPEERVASDQLQAPEIVQPLKDFRLMEGTDVTFVCKVTGRPRPKIAWYKDGKRIRRGPRYDIKYSMDGYCTLRIKAGLPSDTGHYTVLAVNSVGKTTCSAQLFVDAVGNIDATSFVSPETLSKILRRDSVRDARRPSPEEEGGVYETVSKPQFKRIPTDVEIREGNPVRMDCLVVGRPVPELSWYCNGVQVHNDDNHKIVINEDGVNSLLLVSASRHDSGTYTCVAKNRGGEDTFTVNVTVLEREKMEPPRFIDRMQNFTVGEGQSVTLTCLASGVPTPNMSWQKDGKMITELDYRIDTEGGRSTLYIDQAAPSDSSWFQCSAVNVAGTASTRAKLVVQPDLSKREQPKPAEFARRVSSPPHYDIHSVGPVQQISYVDEHDSAVLKLLKEEDLISPSRARPPALAVKPAPPPTSPKPSWPVKAPLPTPETSTPMVTTEDEDEERYKRKTVAEAKRLFGKPTEQLLVPPPKLARPSKPITVLFKPARDESPSYDIHKTGPVQLISYASDSERGYLRLLEESDLPRKVPQQAREEVAQTFVTRKSVEKEKVVSEVFRDMAPISRSLTPTRLIVSRKDVEKEKVATEVFRDLQPASSAQPPKMVVVTSRDVDKEKVASEVFKDYVPELSAPPMETVVVSSRDVDKEKVASEVFKDYVPELAAPPMETVVVSSRDVDKEKVASEVFKDYVPELSAPPMETVVVSRRDVDKEKVISEVFRDFPQETLPTLQRTLSSATPTATQPPGGLSPFEAVIPIQPKQKQFRHVEAPATKLPANLPRLTMPKRSEPVKAPIKHVEAPKPVPKPAPPSATKTVSMTVTPTTPVPPPVRTRVRKPPTPPEAKPIVLRQEWYPMPPEAPLTAGEPMMSPEDREYQQSAVEEHIRREGEAPPPEDLYDREHHRPARFKTQIKDLPDLKENDAAHFECKLLPLGDPTMKVEWFKDGEPLHHGTRYKPSYDFGFVTLDIMWVYAEDSGVYECRATNDYGEDSTAATIACRPLRSIIMDSNLPGDQAIKLQEMEAAWKTPEEGPVIEEPKEQTPPMFDLRPEPVETAEGEPAKFMVKVGGYPRPRVTWWINGSQITGGTRFKVTYDGMMHYLEIPRCREYDAGQVRVIAKNRLGEEEYSTTLNVVPKDDWRSKLKQAPKGDLVIELERRKKLERRTAELDQALTARRPRATEIDVRQIERGQTAKLRLQKDNEVVMSEQQYISVHTQLRHKDGAVVSEPVHVERNRIVPISAGQQAAPPGAEPVLAADLLPETQVVKQQITLQRGEPPVFTKPLRPVRVPESTGVTLEVHFKGIPPPVITWYRDNFEIQPSRDFQISTTETTSSLHVPEVFIEDAGLFTVKAYNKFGMVQCKAKLTVEEGEAPEKEVPPEFRSLARDTKVFQGEPVTFDCQITGSPTPEVHWTKEGYPLPESPRWKFIKDDDVYTMVLYEAQPLDAGVYACVAINNVGKATCTARLTVDRPEKPLPSPTSEPMLESEVEPPYVVEEPRMLDVEEGEPVRFCCTIKGRPHPQVTWYRNNQLVKPSKYFRMDSTMEGIHTLTIMEAFPEDAGTYKCVARNKAGEVTVVTQLKVHGESESETSSQPEVQLAQPPSFIRPISNTIVTEGTPAKFEAVFSGVPSPEITWIRNGIQTLTDSREYKIETVDRLTNLTIYKSHPEDTGLITCRAKNHVGTAECSAELYVQPEEETRQLAQQLNMSVAKKPPEFVKPLMPYQEFTIGETLRMEAEIVGEPLPCITWYKDGIEIQTTEKTKILREDRKAVLILIDVSKQDAGEYVLKVENELGEITCKTMLLVKGREKEIEIPGQDMEDALTITRTVTTTQREEQVIVQQVKPTFVTPLEPEIYVRERGIARLECQVDAAPAPLVTWFVNGMEIKPSPHYEIQYEDGKSVLLIIEVGPQDTGEYTCRAVSELGEAVSSTTLYVQEPAKTDIQRPEDTSALVQPSPTQLLSPPVFLDTLTDIQAEDGQELQMTCRVSGTPMPSVSFFHDSKNIDDDEEFVISYNPETGEVTLIIVEVFPEDQGQYICVAENPAGHATTSSYLTVLETRETTMELEPEQPQEEIITVDTSAPQELVFTVKPEESPAMEVEPEEVPEDIVVPHIIDRPKVQPLEKEEPMQESPIFSPIPDSVASVTSSDTYYTAQEEVEEEVTEVPLKPKLIERPKVVPLEEEKPAESPVREIMAPVEAMEVEPEEEKKEVEEAVLEKETHVKDLTIPELKEEEAEVILQESTTTSEVTTETEEVTIVLQDEDKPAEEEVKTVPEETIQKEATPPNLSAGDDQLITVDTIIEAILEDQQLVQPPEEMMPEQEADEVAPEFVELLQPQVVNDSESLTMTCRVVASPAPQITWYKNTTEITTGPDIKIYFDEDTGTCTLEIAEVFPDDAGEITCQAVNPFGEAMTSATLIIQETEETEISTTEETTTTETITTTTTTLKVAPEEEEDTEVKLVDETHTTRLDIAPNFVKPLVPNTTADEGDTVRLEVIIEAEPEATIKWYRDELQLTSSEKMDIVYENNICTLTISDVRPEDSGDYICEAENLVGKTTCKTTLTVNPLQRMVIEIQPDEMPKEETFQKQPEPVSPEEAEEDVIQPQKRDGPEESVHGEPPEFTVLLESMTVKDTERVVFKVKFTGNPSPQITWYFDGSPIKPSTDFQINVDLEQGESTLVIVEVFPEDEGEYSCIAVNDFGESVTTCRLKVVTTEEITTTDEVHKETIEIDHSPDQVIEVPEETTVKETIEFETLAKPQEEPQTQTVEFEIGKPFQEQPATTSTTLVQESNMTTQIVREIEEEMPTVTEGPTMQTTTLSVRKDEELAPVEMQISLSLPEGEEDVVDHVTEATRTTTTEIRSIPVEDTSLPVETHTETIEITTQPDTHREVTETTTTTTEVSMTVEPTKPQTQRIEVEIQETTLQKEPQTQELQVAIGKISSTADIPVSQPVEALQSPRPSEDLVEETRSTIVKEVKTIEPEKPEVQKEEIIVEYQEPEVQREEIQIDFKKPETETEEVHVTFPVSVPEAEKPTDIAEIEIKVPADKTDDTQPETVEMTIVPSDVDLIAEDKPRETEEDIKQDDVEAQPPMYEVIETERDTVEMTIVPSEVDEVAEKPSEETHIEFDVVQRESVPEDVIEKMKVDETEVSNVISAVDTVEIEVKPDEIETAELVIPISKPIEDTMDTETAEVEMVIQIPSEVSEVSDDAKPQEAEAPLQEQISETVETIVISSPELLAEQAPDAVTEVQLITEDKPTEDIEETKPSDVTSAPETTVVTTLEAQVPLTKEETRVEAIDQPLPQESTFTIDVTGSKILQSEEDDMEEVTLEVQMEETEGVQPATIITEKEAPVVSETEPTNTVETHKGEIEFQIKKPEPEEQPQEIQLSIQLEPQQETSTIEIQPQEDQETTVSVPLIETALTEQTVMDDEVKEETHREELTFQIQGGKTQELEEMAITLQVSQVQPQETPDVDEQMPEIEQTLQLMDQSGDGRAPEFTWGLMSLKVMDGEEVKFRCEVTAEPMPEISWYHDDKIITENQDFNLTYDVESGACTLLIAEVFPQDAGEYKCIAVNPHGEAVTRAMLEVESYEYMADTEEASDSMMSSLEPSSPKPGPGDSDSEPVAHSQAFVEQVQKLQQQYSELTESEEEIPKEDVLIEEQPEVDEAPEVLESSEIVTEVAKPSEEQPEPYQTDLSEETIVVSEVSEVPQDQQEDFEPKEIQVEFEKPVEKPETVFKVEEVREETKELETPDVAEEEDKDVTPEEIVVELEKPSEEQPVSFKTELVQETVSSPDVVEVSEAPEEDLEPKEIVVEFEKSPEKLTEVSKAEPVQETVSQQEVTDTTEASEEDLEPKEIEVQFETPDEGQPEQFQTDFVQEVVAPTEVAEVAGDAAEDLEPKEIVVEFEKPSAEEPVPQSIDVAQEDTDVQEVSDVAEEPVADAFPVEVLVQLDKTSTKLAETVLADAVHEAVALSEAPEVTNTKEMEITPSEVAKDFSKPTEEAPQPFKTELVQETVSDKEATNVTDETEEEDLEPKEITVEFEQPLEEQPKLSQVIEEEMPQTDVSDLAQDSEEDLEPKEIVVEFEKPSDVEPEILKTEPVEEVIEQPETSDIVDQSEEDLEPKEIIVEFEKPSEEKTEEYETQVVEETVPQSDVAEVAEEPEEDIEPKEIVVEFEQQSEEQPESFTTDVTEEMVPDTEVSQVAETLEEDLEPKVIEVEIVEPSKEQPETKPEELTQTAPEDAPEQPQPDELQEQPQISQATEEDVRTFAEEFVQKVIADVRESLPQEETIVPEKRQEPEEEQPDQVDSFRTDVHIDVTKDEEVTSETTFVVEEQQEEETKQSTEISQIEEKEEGEAPRFSTTLSNITVKENTTMVLEVAFTGSPEPKVTWFVDEEELSEVEDVEIVTESYRSTLTIPEVFSEDEGEYKVELTNQHGKAVSTAYIKVAAISPEEDTPTYELEKPQDEQIEEERGVIIVDEQEIKQPENEIMEETKETLVVRKPEKNEEDLYGEQLEVEVEEVTKEYTETQEETITDDTEEEIREEEETTIEVEEIQQKVEETIEEVVPSTFEETLEIEVKKPTVEDVATHEQIITFDFEKPQEVEEVEEVPEIPIVDETPDTQTEQPQEDIIKETKETIVVEKKVQQEVGETIEEVAPSTFEETPEIE
ncbi:titin, partial [Elysia marginata]